MRAQGTLYIVICQIQLLYYCAECRGLCISSRLHISFLVDFLFLFKNILTHYPPSKISRFHDLRKNTPAFSYKCSQLVISSKVLPLGLSSSGIKNFCWGYIFWILYVSQKGHQPEKISGILMVPKSMYIKNNGFACSRLTPLGSKYAIHSNVYSKPLISPTCQGSSTVFRLPEDCP